MILNNQAKFGGGGFFLQSVDNVEIKDSEMRSNYLISKDKDHILTDTMGGAIYLEESENFALENSTIYNSYSFFKGGAIYL